MPYAVDNEFFRTAAERARPHRERLRAELGLQPGRAVILFASKMQPHKRAADLLEAYARLSPDTAAEPAAYLVFAGDGEERARLERRARALKWDSIRFIGFRNQSELPALYDLCDVFVLPSEHEPWGLVVNEAMNAGKPVIVSDRVGAGPDLVEDGVNWIRISSARRRGACGQAAADNRQPRASRRDGRARDRKSGAA